MADLAYDTLVEGKPVAVEVNGTQVCVAKVGDEVFAVADTCTHSEASFCLLYTSPSPRDS